MKKIFIIFLSMFAFGWAYYSIYRIATTTAPDFSVLWLIARDFGKAANPYLNPAIYTPSGYPPFTYLFYLPLTFFSFNIALAIFLLISLSAIMASVLISQNLTFKKIDLFVFLTASGLALISFPVKFTLGMGQINAIVLFLLLFSYSISLNKKEMPAGILMGFAIILKPVFAFFLLFFLFRRNWRLIYYALLTVIAGFFITYLFYGFPIWEYWLKANILPLANLAGREVYYNQGFLGFVSRISGNIEVRKIAEYIIAAAMLIPIYIFRKTKDANLLLSLFISTLILADSLSWQHHFVWLIFPFISIAYYAVRLKKAWIWFLLIFAYALVSWNFKNPEVFSAFPVSLILSNTFYGGIILYSLNIYFLKLNLNNNR